MLNNLTDAALDAKIFQLRSQIEDAESRIKTLTAARTRLVNELVAKCVPELSKKVAYALDGDFPMFLRKPELRKMFFGHMPILGLFKRAGYDQALALVQAQFRAHLNVCGRLKTEDGLLAEAIGRKNTLLRDYVAAEGVRQRRLSEARALPVADDYVSVAGDVIDLTLNHLGVTQQMQRAVVDEVRQMCVPVDARPCIATDDQLGYFS